MQLEGYPFSALTLLVGRNKGHPICKKTECWGAGVVVCLSAYGPADATATHCLLLQQNLDWFYLSGTGSLGSTSKRAVKRVCVCVQLEGDSQPTCNKHCASRHYELDRRRCNSQVRPPTSFVDHTIDLMWRNFLSPEFGAKFQRFQRKVPLFWRYPNLLTTQFRYKPACDGRTDRHTTTAYTALA